MTKALSLILGLLMIVQIIYPIGLPGLKRRADAWKIAVLALALILAVATLRPPPAAAAQSAEISAKIDHLRTCRGAGWAGRGRPKRDDAGGATLNSFVSADIFGAPRALAPKAS